VSNWLTDREHEETDIEIQSVTSVVKSFFPCFNPDEVIGRMMASKRWPKSKYFGKTAEQIKEGWDTLKNEASSKGTAMHMTYEEHYNQYPLPQVPNTTVHLSVHEHFCNFVKDHQHWIPYRTEWTVFTDSFYQVCGSIDLLVFDEKFHAPNDGYLYLTMVDWKRSKKISDFNLFGECGSEMLSHIPNTNYFHYALQLNIYRHIIHNFYRTPTTFRGTEYPKGIKIIFLYIVITHPNRPSYIKLMLPDYSKLVVEIFEKRRSTIERKKKV
jgi:hypothetical protein